MAYLVYTLPNCPYCHQAKALLQAFDKQYEEREGKTNDWPTVPAIYKVVGEALCLVGGLDQLLELAKSGKI